MKIGCIKMVAKNGWNWRRRLLQLGLGCSLTENEILKHLNRLCWISFDLIYLLDNILFKSLSSDLDCFIIIRQSVNQYWIYKFNIFVMNKKWNTITDIYVVMTYLFILIRMWFMFRLLFLVINYDHYKNSLLYLYIM